MSSRTTVLLSLALASFAALGSQTLSYALVYPARQTGTKLPLLLALLGGALTACLAGWLSLRAQRHAAEESERFAARLGVLISAFFLFVIVFGFGIPNLILGTQD